MVVACSYKILWPKIDFLIFLPHFPLSTGHFFQHGGQVRKMQKKSFFLQKWPVPMLVQNISRGHEILKTFWIFGAPYSSIVSCCNLFQEVSSCSCRTDETFNSGLTFAFPAVMVKAFNFLTENLVCLLIKVTSGQTRKIEKDFHRAALHRRQIKDGGAVRSIGRM